MNSVQLLRSWDGGWFILYSLFFILQTFDPSGVEKFQENPTVLTFHVFEEGTSVRSFVFVSP